MKFLRPTAAVIPVFIMRSPVITKWGDHKMPRYENRNQSNCLPNIVYEPQISIHKSSIYYAWSLIPQALHTAKKLLPCRTYADFSTEKKVERRVV